MVSYLDLFLVFLKLGFIMFGGGYAGIGVYYKVLVEEKGWIAEEEFASIVGIAGSLPGPIAINTAIWIGYSLKGILGSIIATMAVILPGFLMVLGIIMALKPYMDHWVTKALFRGIGAAVIAIIFYVLLRLANSTFIKGSSVDWVSVAMFTVFTLLLFTLRPNPVIVIVVAALFSLLLKLLVGV